MPYSSEKAEMEEGSEIILTLSQRRKVSRCGTQRAKPSSHTWKHTVGQRKKVYLICQL